MKIHEEKIINSFIDNDMYRQRQSIPLYDELIQKSKLFEWVHTGKSSMSIDQLISIIHESQILPARTGHLGNWQEIALGRSGSLDHNATTCGAKKIGFPHITDFLQTENLSMEQGDVIYLPGSIIHKENRKILDLYTWDGRKYKQRSREDSYFLPFVLTPVEDKLEFLSKIQKANCNDYKNVSYSSSIIMENISLAKEIIKVLITTIHNTPNCPVKLSDIIDRAITVEGNIYRETLTYTNGYYKLGNTVLGDIDQLIEVLFVPIAAAHNPKEVFSNPKELPSVMPFISLPLQCILDYVLFNIGQKNNDSNIQIYMEWGAFGSAGYPPRNNGYYKQKSKLIRKIYTLLIAQFPQLKPLFFVLLPSAIFNLLPSTAYETDAVYVKGLIRNVIENNKDNTYLESDLLIKKTNQITSRWLELNRHNLSRYYIGRFANRRCIHHQTQYHDYGKEVDLREFYQLSIQQACMLLGSLHELLGNQ